MAILAYYSTVSLPKLPTLTNVLNFEALYF